MIDPKLLREDIDNVKQNLKMRGYDLPAERIVQLDNDRKNIQIITENLQHERNLLSREIGELKKNKQDATAKMQQVVAASDELKKNQEKLELIQADLEKIYLDIPNLLDKSVPYGESEADNIEIKKHGTPREFDFAIKDHIELGQKDDMLDMATGAKLSGARFAVYRKNLARLHRALGQFMLDLHINQHGYQEISVPLLVKTECLEGTGQLPKFAEDLFFSKSHNHEFGLIPTSEVPLTNLVRDQILQEHELPLKLVAHSSCFRSEAGSYGRDTKGIMRLHQFEKVELVHIAHPSNSMQMLEEMLSHAEKVLQLLELPYRVISLCSQDIGFSASKTYDIEVWVPSENTYREISSCSNCKDFQARRIKARFKNKTTNKNELVHTLNGSGIAISRALLAVMENYQQPNGVINIPRVLQPYMGGLKAI